MVNYFKLFDYERYSDKYTVHMSNKRKTCSLKIKNEYLKNSIQ